MQLYSNLNILWHCPSLGLEWKLTFPVLWPLLSFPILLAYWVQRFHSMISLFSSISLLWSRRKAFLSLRALLWKSAFIWAYLPLSPFLSFLFFSQLFVRPPQTTTLPSCISFSWGWFWSPPSVQCYEPLSIFLQALCLTDLVPWIYLSPLLYNHKGFDLGHTWMASVFFFSYFLQFEPEFFNKELMVSSRSSFCWLYATLHLWLSIM